METKVGDAVNGVIEKILDFSHDHEKRLAKVEEKQEQVAELYNRLDSKIDDLSEGIKSLSDEQRELFTMMNKRMVDEFFKKKNINLSNKWKLILSFFGGGSFLYIVIEIVKYF